jgi:hypothetical protein
MVEKLLDDQIGFLAGKKLAGMEELNHPDLAVFKGVKAGSLEAKAKLAGWEKGIKAQGTFLGKPLQPGAHQGDGDFQFLRWRVYEKTGDWEMAGRIAGKVNKVLNGG